MEANDRTKKIERSLNKTLPAQPDIAGYRNKMLSLSSRIEKNSDLCRMVLYEEISSDQLVNCPEAYLDTKEEKAMKEKIRAEDMERSKKTKEHEDYSIPASQGCQREGCECVCILTVLLLRSAADLSSTERDSRRWPLPERERRTCILYSVSGRFSHSYLLSRRWRKSKHKLTMVQTKLNPEHTPLFQVCRMRAPVGA